MFILNLTGPASDRPEGPSFVLPPNFSHGRNGSGQNLQSSGPDSFDGTVENQHSLNCFNAHLSEFGRRVIELVNSNNELSPSTRDLITQLVSSRSFRLGIIGAIYGEEAVNCFNELNKKDTKESEQRETLMALIAIAEPTQIIAAINCMKGALLPQVQSLAEGMLAQARDLAQWLAEKRAQKGDPGAAMALYEAEQVGGNQPTFSIQTFVSRMVSYDPARVLNDAQSTADEANKKKNHQLTVKAEIGQLENIVGNSTTNTPVVAQAKERLTDLRNMGIA